eukprot:scaffold48_cov311-Pinguiococcus_pyrenoidosus.AAC.283
MPYRYVDELGDTTCARMRFLIFPLPVPLVLFCGNAPCPAARPYVPHSGFRTGEVESRISTSAASTNTATVKPAAVRLSKVCWMFRNGHPARALPPIGLRPACSTKSSASAPKASKNSPTCTSNTLNSGMDMRKFPRTGRLVFRLHRTARYLLRMLPLLMQHPVEQRAFLLQ